MGPPRYGRRLPHEPPGDELLWHTLAVYDHDLRLFAKVVAEWWTPVAIQQHLTSLHERLKPVSVHQHFRCLRTFFKWAVDVGLLRETPMRGLRVQVPKTLPHVPEDEDVRRLLQACPDTFYGHRSRALVALLADSALRISEALRLRIEDLNFSARTIAVHGGKGGKDGVGHLGSEAIHHVRSWLACRRNVYPEDFVFTTKDGRAISRHCAMRLLHRLSARAGLQRRVSPHALRHYAATSILRQTGDLELVRQVLRHESLAMSLRYARLASVDVSAKFRRASPLDNLRTSTA